MDFLSSTIGQYIVQATLHSVIIAIVVEAMLRLWDVQQPYLQIRFRLLDLLLPVICLPLYFLLYPPRAEAYFREQVALIDFNEWLQLRLWGYLEVWHLLAALLALTTAYFIIREAIPSLRHYFGYRHSLPDLTPGQFPKLDMILKKLAQVKGFPRPRVLISPEDTPIVHTLRHYALVLSPTTINMLDDDELEAVIAHELAHLTRQAYGISQASLVLRFLMFYNPVALLIFRHIINDNEKKCDDIAIRATGKRLALASALFKISRRISSASVPTSNGQGRIPQRVSALEHWTYRELIKERVERLVHPAQPGNIAWPNFRVFFTGGLLVALLFFVV